MMTIRACATASIVFRATILWVRKMMQLLPDSKSRLLEGASQMLKGSSFTGDATLDALTFTSRVMASTGVARRGLWLQVWQVLTHSKQIISSCPFQGEKLFGEALVGRHTTKRRPCPNP